MSASLRVEQIQEALRQSQLDGWLFYDFRNSNPLSRSVLQMDQKHVGSRRWFYYVPAQGMPVRLVHAIEAGALDQFPGEKVVYRSWRSLHAALGGILEQGPKIAMEYSARANNPYVSRVDAGTVELVRSLGGEIVSSGNLLQAFQSCLTEEQWESHLQADHITTSAFEVAWDFIAENIAEQGRVEELAVCQRILEHFKAHQMFAYAPPIVAKQPNNRLPHYETGTGTDTRIQAGDLVLIDLWCKSINTGGIYSDLTRMAYVGAEIPEEYQQVFAIVANARNAGIEFVRQAFAENRCPAGWEVDHVVREVIEQAGYGEAFLHRTGHSLGMEVHGNGAHLDDLEMHEDRQILPSSLFTIEPGIYLEHFGMRSEVNVFVDATGQVHVTGLPVQNAIHSILV